MAARRMHSASLSATNGHWTSWTSGSCHRDDDNFLKRGSDVPATGNVTGTVTVVHTVAIVLTQWPMCEGHRDDDNFLKRGSDVPATGNVTGTVTVVHIVAIVLTQWPMCKGI